MSFLKSVVTPALCPLYEEIQNVCLYETRCTKNNKITTKGILEPEIDFSNLLQKKIVAKSSEDAAVFL